MRPAAVIVIVIVIVCAAGAFMVGGPLQVHAYRRGGQGAYIGTLSWPFHWTGATR
jgi:hypothetical protein